VTLPSIDTSVLIVGAGPTGLTAGLLLAQLGIDYHLVERRSGPQRAPAAHVVNARSFEIWRQAGLDRDTFAAVAKDPRDAGAVYWVTRLGGDILGRLPFERQGDDVLDVTPTPLRNLSQHRLEPLLRDALTRVGKGPSYRNQWESSQQDSDGVHTRIRDLGGDATYDVHSRYLIAADGAGSPVRKSLGIAPVGPDRLQSFIMIHFEANLRSLVGNDPGVLYWISDPSCGGIFVAHDIDREWVFMHPWDADREPIAQFDPVYCEGIVRRAMARDDVPPLTIRNVSPWAMTSQVAERYGEGRIFLAGDAAHRFPPTGGLGLNTGVQDVHNLVWKIAAVEHGWAQHSILDTYEVERQPIAQYNAEQSLNNAVRLLEVQQAIGVDGDPDVAQRNFQQLLVSPDRRATLAAAIANQAEHFDMLGLQLGYAYEKGALLGDGTDRIVPDNPVREILPSTRPGERLPHGWVQSGSRRVSTLDLVALDRFTLLVGPQGAAWREAAASLPVPMQIVEIGTEVVDPACWWSTTAAMGADGALLIRPDQHVAFRAQHGGGDCCRELEKAFTACHTRRG